MNRRTFLRTAGLLGGAAIGGPTLLRFGSAASASTRAVPRAPRLADAQIHADSVLNHPASECPVDTVVVLTMENRSFDHYFGHLATDQAYVEEGRRAHGKDFALDGRIDVHYH